jgi:hypothetical protein
MPGHIHKTEGPDPDPAPWLEVSAELKVKLKSKPYDAKKSCWVPNKATHGYDEGLIESADGDKVTVEILETKEVQNLICSSVIEEMCLQLNLWFISFFYQKSERKKRV